MAISDKTRKLLWTRAHNACAMCHRTLTRDADDAELPGIVTGQEAHIIAKAKNGPRAHDGDGSDLDGYDNLLLLCAEDHKTVDEQPDVYPVERLRMIKVDHEEWAANRWSQDHVDDPIVQVKRAGEDSIKMDPVLSGAQVWNLVEGAGIYYFRSVEGEVDRDAARAADDFLTTARDWGGISEAVQDQGFAAVREAQESIQEMLLDLWAHSLFVYGRRVIRTLKGGAGRPIPFPAVHLVVLTADELREQGGFPDTEPQLPEDHEIQE